MGYTVEASYSDYKPVCIGDMVVFKDDPCLGLFTVDGFIVNDDGTTLDIGCMDHVSPENVRKIDDSALVLIEGLREEIKRLVGIYSEHTSRRTLQEAIGEAFIMASCGQGMGGSDVMEHLAHDFRLRLEQFGFFYEGEQKDADLFD